MDEKELDHAGRTITLRGPASQNLNLEGSGLVAIGHQVLAWEPDNREANEIEIRARMLSTDAIIGSIPVVRWFSEIGHGDAVWREPQPALPIVQGTPITEYSLPARGMVWRTTSREFRIGFRLQGVLAGPAPTKATIQVTILPGWGLLWPTYPYQHIVFPTAGIVTGFPMTAREWRLTDAVGRPLAPAAVSVTFVGIVGALFGVSDGALFDDWRPLPHDAVGFSASAPCFVSYR